MSVNFRDFLLQDDPQIGTEGFAPIEKKGGGRWRWALGPSQRLHFFTEPSPHRLQYRFYFPQARSCLTVSLNGSEIARISSSEGAERVEGYFDFSAQDGQQTFEFAMAVSGQPDVRPDVMAFSVERFRAFPLLASAERLTQSPKEIIQKGVPATFCPLPFVSFFVATDGRSFPCCESVDPVAEDAANSGQISLIQDSTGVEQAWNSSFMKSIRRDLISGQKPDACRNCFKLEAVGARSRRQQMLDVLLDPAVKIVDHMDTAGAIDHPPTALDLQIGNLCNLRCRMCGPKHSVNMIKEFDELYGPSFSSYRDNHWHGNQRLLKTLADLAGHTNYIQAIGGELLLSPDFLVLMDEIIQRGHAGEIQLTINTNLTSIQENVFSRFKAFKGVHLMVSLEAFGSLNDYIRYPSKFARIDQNLRFLHDNPDTYHVTQVSFNTTVQAYNVLELAKLLRHLRDSFPRFDWFPQLSALHGPEPLSALIVKPEFREEAIRELRAFESETRGLRSLPRPDQLNKMETEIRSLTNFLRGPDLSNLAEEFHHLNKIYDRNREKVHELRIPGITF